MLIESAGGTRGTDTVADHRLDPAGESYPLDLGDVADLEGLRKALLRSMAQAGRSVDSAGGGDARKRTRFVISVDGAWTSVALGEQWCRRAETSDTSPLSSLVLSHRQESPRLAGSG
ncbi:MAG: hypothetical protein JJU45_11435 [Acidimicrobiia bacterium]|nr:hypothetical protein [Acidimicrobiia bacterium]